MTVPARRAVAASDLDNDELEEAYAAADFYSGERICTPFDDGYSRGGGIIRTLVVIALTLGGGWAGITYHETWRPWVASGLAAVAPLIDPKTPAPVAAAAATTMPSPPPLPTATIPPAPPIAAVETPAPPKPAAPVETASIERSEAPPADAPAAQPLPPPVIEPSDPYQKRAAAVGLHPQLSRVLLQRLSPADYRNARTAIETAIAKTPDTATFVWPRQRTPDLALFEVRFVAGAAPHCRRYVVTVTKDRWSTTALPMEKCGIATAQRKAG